jgi:biotin carboxyl carrier protein
MEAGGAHRGSAFVTFDVETDETRRLVDVAGQGGKYKVVSGTTSYVVDASRVDEAWSLLIRSADNEPLDSGIGGLRSYDVAFGPTLGDECVVYVNHKAVTVRLAEQLGRPGAARLRAGRTGVDVRDAQQGAVTVVTPMPGRVVKVLVKAGDLVRARQGVAVVEAMKMENEVRAPRGGTIKEIRVAPGALVEAGAVLLVIE